MALLCFMLDLLSLSPPLLKDLKQCLLQLANLYAISSGKGESESSSLQDRIGLCYVQKNKVSCDFELKIAYSPQGKYNLRDFHHAVNSLPTDGFLPELSGFGAVECYNPYEALSKLLSNEALFSWASKDILKKVVLLTSCLERNIDPLQKPLMDAAEQCISIEFVLLEQEANHNEGMFSEYVNGFSDSISNLKNCSLGRYFPNTWVLCALVKKWLQELKDEEPLQAIFIFRNGLIRSINQIFCNLFPSAHQIIDGFSPCQTCRCHGLPIDGSASNKVKGSCPLMFHELEACDLVENAVRIGEQTILFLPSFQSCPKLKQVSAPIVFNVIERTSLASLSEGVVIGTSYVVTPSTFNEMEAASDDYDKSELNLQLYHGLCQTLYSLDEGLVCSSNCNTQTMMEATFQCFYILQPSEKGPMLLRSLAGSEEMLPIPDVIQSKDALVPNEIDNYIQTTLSKLGLREYNPLLHERGLHPKLNWLVKESLHFGSIPPTNRTEMSSEEPIPKSSDPHLLKASTQPPPAVKVVTVEEKTQPTLTAEEDVVAASITQEWEEMIVNEVGKSYSPTCISKPKSENLVLLLSDNKPLDEKTCRILERLEAPRWQKTKEIASPVISVSNVMRDACGPMKKPLVPFGLNNSTDNRLSLSQPMKPNFQRMKRKLR